MDSSTDLEGQEALPRHAQMGQLRAEHLRVYTLLQNVDAQFADFYLGGALLLSLGLPDSAKAHFLAYAGREVCDRLDLCLGAERVVGEDGKITASSKFSGVVQAGEHYPVVEVWDDLRQGFNASAHLRAPGQAPPSADYFADLFDRLTSVLLYLLEPHYETIDELDAVLGQGAPDPETVGHLVEMLSSPAKRAYFFGRLSSSAWLAPLDHEGFFSSPPNAIHNAEDGTVRLVAWPEGRYLARAAEAAPEEVCEIAVRLMTQPSPAIDNPWVVNVFIDAAMLMPPLLASGIAHELPRFFGLIGADFIVMRSVDLIRKLADGSEPAAALRLLDKTLQLHAEPRPGWEAIGGDANLKRAVPLCGPRARFGARLLYVAARDRWRRRRQRRLGQERAGDRHTGRSPGAGRC